MTRRFNYTGRTKLSRAQCPLRLDNLAGEPYPRFSFDTGPVCELGLPASAEIVVEAYVRQSVMRFGHGTLGSPSTPTDTALDSLDQGTTPQFRVKIIDTEVKPGRLLALGNQLRATETDDDDSRRSILPLSERDLGELVWRVVVGPEDSPILEINNRVPDLRQRVLTDPLIGGAIFPQAAWKILDVVLSMDPPSEEEWASDWTRFAEHILKQDITVPVSPGDELETILETITSRFSEQQQWATRTVVPQEQELLDYE